jgi:predicted RNase H-like nuclease (RuvC/YqgF family)
MRLQLAMREQRDDAVDALKKKFATKMASLQEKIRKAQLVVEREADQASQAKMQTAISFGATLLGAVLGRKSGIKSTVGKATTAARGLGRSAQQQSDVARAKETVETYQQQLEDLNSEFEAEAEALANKIDPMSEELEPVTIRPKKTDISVQLVALVWVPYRDGEPAW